MDYSVINICAPEFNSDTGIKKGIIIEVFLMYIIYLVINAVSYYQNPDQDQTVVSKDNDGIAPPNQPQNKSSFINSEPLNRFFTVFLGYHIVPVGMVLLYCPFVYAIICAYLHFLGILMCQIGYLAVIIGYKYEKDTILKAGYGISQFMNVMLIFGAIVQISKYSSC